jgi:hypothetical protein
VLVQDVAVADEVVVRDAETAGGGALVDVDCYDAAGAGYGFDLLIFVSEIAWDYESRGEKRESCRTLCSCTKLSYSHVPFSIARPVPHILTILGGPTNAMNLLAC